MLEQDYLNLKLRLFDSLRKHKEAMDVLSRYEKTEVVNMCHNVIQKQIERELFYIKEMYEKTKPDNVIAFRKSKDGRF